LFGQKLLLELVQLCLAFIILELKLLLLVDQCSLFEEK